MKKWLFAMLISVSLILLVACGGSDKAGSDSSDTSNNTNGSTTNDSAQSEVDKADVDENEKFEIKFAHVVRPTTAKGQAAEKFAELIEERSDGRITVKIYPDSQLGSDREITEQMQSGTVDMNAPFTGVLPAFVPQFQVFDLPYLFEDKEEAYETMHGELGERLNEYLAGQGLRAIGYWDGGFKHFTNSIRPIEVPEDMNDMRMRASQSPLIISQFRALNAGGVSIDFSELYTALQNGTVDGQENPLSNVVTRKFYEVQDYLTLSSHGYMGYVHLISEKFYESLPEDLKETMNEVAIEVSQWQWEQAKLDEEKYMEELLESGIEITELTPENKEKFFEVMKSAYDEFEKIEGSEELLQILDQK